MVVNSKFKNPRFFALDYLRGLAALSVVIFHYTYGYDNGLHKLSNNKFYLTYGNLGVQLFFIISGFVISMTLERTKTSLDFFVSRFSRLYPAYWGGMFLTIIFVSLFANPFEYDKVTLKQILINITMLQHWVKVKDIDAVYWTLSVELTFYFLMWLLFYLKKLKYIEYVSIAWLLLSFFDWTFGLPGRNILEQIFILQYIPMFIAGIVFYNIRITRKTTPLRVFLLFFSLVVESIILKKFTHSLIPTFIVSLFYVFFIAIIKDSFVIKENKILLFFGNISYSLYLIHENIGLTLEYQIRKATNLEILYVSIPVILSVFLAYLLTTYIEKPAMKYVRDYYRSYKSKKNQNLDQEGLLKSS
ncbi:MAG: hypothetical protein JWR50_2354 [Mucilaginibacter sp.]|nr:hypothetical protein [Mucilaginibacter sp.]